MHIDYDACWCFSLEADLVLHLAWANVAYFSLLTAEGTEFKVQLMKATPDDTIGLLSMHFMSSVALIVVESCSQSALSFVFLLFSQ
jgi:hypothetical protein